MFPCSTCNTQFTKYLLFMVLYFISVTVGDNPLPPQLLSFSGKLELLCNICDNAHSIVNSSKEVRFSGVCDESGIPVCGILQMRFIHDNISHIKSFVNGTCVFSEALVEVCGDTQCTFEKIDPIHDNRLFFFLFLFVFHFDEMNSDSMSLLTESLKQD